MKLPKVYLVWKGEYSDARVEAVFSTEKKADKYSKHINGYVIPEDVDSVKIAPIRDEYWVTVREDTNEILKVDNRGTNIAEVPRVAEIPNRYAHSVTTEIFGDEGTFTTYVKALKAVVYAKDEAHARKIATDAVAKYKAEGLGLLCRG